MNSARSIFRNIAIFIVFSVPIFSLAAPLYQPGETLNPSCLPSNADCTVATSTASYFTATSTTATSTFPNLSLTNLLIGSDYVTDLTGSGLSIVNGALTASGGSFATTTNDYWLTQQYSLSNLASVGSTTGTTNFFGTSVFNGNLGLGTTSPYTKLSVVGDIVATNITATSSFNTSGTAGGYKIDGNLILQASSTNFSTLVGKSAGAALLSDGLYNVAVGHEALRNATSSDFNTAVGYRSLYSNTTGERNTANGYFTLYSNTTGSYNSANGMQSLYANTTGISNTANGYASLYLNTTGGYNLAQGAYSLYANTTGSSNVSNGYQALYANTTGNNNTALGYQALQTSTSSDSNTAVGYRSLYLNTTGTGNTASGYASLYTNTTGSNNTANGYTALYANTTGINNTANGVTALRLNTTGQNNTANGYAALYANTTGNQNAALGYGSLYANTTGANNSSIGHASLYTNTIGSNNSAIGISAGRYIADGSTANDTTSNSVFLGYDTRSLTNNDSNQIVIGYSATGLGSNSAVLGNDSITKTILKGNIGVGTTSPFAKLSIHANNGDTNTSLFQIASSTAAATSTHFVVTNAGNVGIGTTTPSTKFQAYYSASRYVSLFDTNSTISNIFRVDDNSAANILTLENRDITATTDQGVDIEYRLANDTTTSAINAGTIRLAKENAWTTTASTNDSYFAFNPGSDGTATERMRIMGSTGNVGIGTTSPYAKLSVTNTGTAPSFLVEDSTSPDATPFIVDASGLVGIGTVPTTLGKLEVSDSATTNSYGISMVKTQSNTVAYQSGISSTFTSNQTSSAFSGVNSAISGQMFIGGSNTQNWTGAQTAEGAGGAAAVLGHVEGRSGWSGTVSNAASFLASNEFSSTGGGVVTNLAGFRVMDSAGTLAPVNQYGVYINALTKGSTSDYGLYFGGAQDSGSIGSAASTHISLMPGTSGNVGIGTTTPFAKLSIHANNGDTNTSLFQIASSTAAATSTLFNVDNAGNVFQQGAALTFGTPSAIVSAVISNGASSGSMSLRSGTASTVILNALNSTSAGRSAVSIFNNAVQSQSSGSNVGLVINPSYNQSGTAANTDLLINRTETALGSGNQYLFDAQVAGASRFNVTNTGKVGIGTTLPRTGLEIGSSSTAYGAYLTMGYSPDTRFYSTISNAFSGSSAAVNYTSFSINTHLGNVTPLTLYGDGKASFSGNLGLGTTTPSARLSLTQSANTSAGGLWIAETGNTDFRSAYMDTSGTMSFYGGDTGGTLNTATLNSSGAWTNASDKSYKENIVDLGTKYGLAAVLASTPRFYEMKGNHIKQVGFVAQELESIIPEVVDGKEGSKGISYGNLVAVAFQAIKELSVKVDGLVANGLSAVKSLFVDDIEVKNKIIIGGEVCVDDVCISKEQFKRMLKDAGGEEKPKENNDKPKDETPKPQETSTTTATTTPEVTKEEPKEEPKEEVKPKEETASTTPEVVKEEPKVEEPVKEEEPVEEAPKVEEKKEEPPKEVVSEPTPSPQPQTP